MYRNKSNRIKKGYILVDTLLLGLVALAVSLLCLNLVITDLKYNKSYYRYTKNSISVRDYKEYLFTQVNNSIQNYAIEKKTDTLKDYLKTYTSVFYTTDNKANISYDNSKKVFVLKSYYDNCSHREDYFNVGVNSGIITYIYEGAIYADGRIGN